MWAERQLWASVAGIIAVVFTLGLSWKATKAAVSAAKAAAISADQGAEALKVAQRSLDIASRNAERELRAYVAPISVTIGEIVEFYYLQFSIEIKNYGQTPAKSVSAQADLKISKERADDPFFPLSQKRALGNIPASSSRTVEFLWPIDFDALEDHVEGKYDAEGYAAVFVFGLIEYVDVFERRQTTAFRFVGRSDSGMAKDFDFCEEGNTQT